MKISFAKKLEMSQIFSDEGHVIPVTKIKLLDDVKVSALMTKDKNGYSAIQAGAQFTKKVGDKTLPRIIKEFRVSEVGEILVGDALGIDQFSVGDILNITGSAKGKGFAGVVKRHGFHGSDATHGTKHVERAGGSIGSGYPEHVFKGRKMPGRAGGQTQTLKNAKVVAIDVEQNILFIKGPVPGARQSLLQIQG